VIQVFTDEQRRVVEGLEKTLGSGADASLEQERIVPDAAASQRGQPGESSASQ
jgi:hypothetical protein